MNYSRSQFLAVALASATTLPIAGCVSPHGHRSSYTNQILNHAPILPPPWAGAEHVGPSFTISVDTNGARIHNDGALPARSQDPQPRIEQA